MEDLTGAGMDSKADRNGNSGEDFNSKKMTVHEDLTLQSGVALIGFLTMTRYRVIVTPQYPQKKPSKPMPTPKLV
jgi:hypothetical protein